MLAAMLAAAAAFVLRGRTPSSSNLPSPDKLAVLTLCVYGSNAPMIPASNRTIMCSCRQGFCNGVDSRDRWFPILDRLVLLYKQAGLLGTKSLALLSEAASKLAVCLHQERS